MPRNCSAKARNRLRERALPAPHRPAFAPAADRIPRRQRARRRLRSVVILLHPHQDRLIPSPRGKIAPVLPVQEQLIQLRLQLDRPLQPRDLACRLVKVQRPSGHSRIIIRKPLRPRPLPVTPQQPPLRQTSLPAQIPRPSAPPSIYASSPQTPSRPAQTPKSSTRSRRPQSCRPDAASGARPPFEQPLPASQHFQRLPAGFQKCPPPPRPYSRRISVLSPFNSPCGSLPAGAFPFDLDPINPIEQPRIGPEHVINLLLAPHVKRPLPLLFLPAPSGYRHPPPSRTLPPALVISRRT